MAGTTSSPAPSASTRAQPGTESPEPGWGGFLVHTGAAGVVDDGRDDFCVILGPPGTTSAATFTRSRTAGPCVEISRGTERGALRGVAVLARNANVATGQQGRDDALEVRQVVADRTGTPVDQLAICSTGVIGRRYPMQSVRAHLAELSWPPIADLAAASRAILTTDTRPKLRTVRRAGVTVAGVAKGVGMLEPDMATMLSFVLTDARVDADRLQELWSRVVDRTYNSVSVDTDTSTSDTALVLASGTAGPVDPVALEESLLDVCTALVRDIASDGEGASTLIVTDVTGADTPQQARAVGKAVVNSPLVKTMVHGADPNWGRVLMAVGKCVDDDRIRLDRLRIGFGGLEVYPRECAEQDLELVRTHLRGPEVSIHVDLGLGEHHWRVYGCDLTEGYVRTNADYTT